MVIKSFYQKIDGSMIEAGKNKKCICGETLELKVKRGCYNGTYDINCNSCNRIFSDNGSAFYHCPVEGNTEVHPTGFDICFSCLSLRNGMEYDFDTDKPNCVCGEPLVSKPITHCYGGTGNIWCDLCGLRIYKSDIMVYHCDRDSIGKHPNGFDVCISCVAKLKRNAEKNPKTSTGILVFNVIKEYVSHTTCM